MQKDWHYIYYTSFLPFYNAKRIKNNELKLGALTNPTPVFLEQLSHKAFLKYVENLEMNNSLKWALFSKISGQITSDTL